MTNPFEDIMKHAQGMQDKIKATQESLKELKIVGESGAGMVKVTMTGTGEVIDLIVDDGIIKEGKQVMLGLIISAFNDAREKREKSVSNQLNDSLGGLSGLSDALASQLFSKKEEE